MSNRIFSWVQNGEPYNVGLHVSDLRFFFTSTFTYPLTAGVVGTPQTTSQPVSSIFSVFSTALWDLANSRPVHSLMLSSHFFLFLPCLLPPFTVPCKMVLARPDAGATCLYHFNWRLFTMVRSLRVVRLPAGSWHGLPRWLHGLCMRCVISCASTSFPWLVFFFFFYELCCEGP